MQGGKREGAGRKPGSVARIDYEARQRALTSGMTPLDYLLTVLRDDALDARTRVDAAKALLPFCHAKLSPSEMDKPPFEAIGPGPQLPHWFKAR